MLFSTKILYVKINWDSDVLSSVSKAVGQLEHLTINKDSIESVADWLAYEEFPFPSNPTLRDDADYFIRATMLTNTLNFAFTDFDKSIKYEIKDNGKVLSDSEAMYFQVNNAISSGIKLTEGNVMASISLQQLENIFVGNIEMPMLKERVEILNEVGQKLVDSYEGDWINFINNGPKKLYSNGDGLIERLVNEFPRFDDSSQFKESKVKLYKLAQLAFWVIHAELSESHYFKIDDMNSMTAFADYIIPVALSLKKITTYSPQLDQKIKNGDLIERDSNEEIEIRIASIYATAILTESINERRPEDKAIIIPQLDYRLWKNYHATHYPHHLTYTTMY